MFGFNRRTVGLIIDDRSLEVVELKRSGSRARLLNFGRKILPRGLVVNGAVQNAPALADIFRQALVDAKPQGITAKKIVFALPESQSYFLVASLPPHEEADTDAVIRATAEDNFPLDRRDLVFSHSLVQKSKQASEIFLAAGSRQVLTGWQDWLGGLGLEISIFDTEFFALARDLVLLDPKSPVCLIDIGAIKTNIVIWQNGLIYYSATLGVGGNFFTKAIADKFQLTMVTAERKKLQLGLNQQIFPVLAGQLKAISAETASAIDYYQNNYGVAVKEVVLLGGSSRLKGLTEFFQEVLTLPVGLGKLKSLTEKFPLEYFGAIGAAWRGLNSKRFSAQPDFNDLLKRAASKIKFKTEAMAIKPKVVKPVARVAVEDVTPAPAGADSEDLNKLATEDESLLVAKINQEKKILLAVLVLGLLLVVGAFWYRNRERDKQAAVLSRYQGTSYDQVQTFNFKLPVVIAGAASTAGEISGRVIETPISSGANFDSVLAEAKIKAQYNLKTNEALWGEPLNEIIDRNNLVFPLTFRWLAYGQKEAMKTALLKVDELNSAQLNYSFNKLEVKGLEKTDRTDLLYLLADITISSNQKLTAGTQPVVDAEPTQAAQTLMASSTGASANLPASSGPAVNTGAQVLILNTETGWLNIREGPGATFAVIKKVNPGEKYEWLDAQGEWIKIRLTDSQTGWGAGRYMRKQ